MKNKFYITSPIYYVNDKPHVGHAYSTIIADTLARYHRALGDEVIFLTGTDENSQKTVDAAQKASEDIVSYTDRLAAIWKSVWKALNISNTDFIRTTELRHRKIVEEFWIRIWDKGDIYKGKYEGLYCKGHEAFIKASDLVDGLCPDHKTKPEHLVEENYFFKLKKYEKDLLAFYEKNPNFVVPENRYNEVKAFVREGLEDLSISRQVQKWGIPVPSDPGHVVYVWFDALINYVSAIGTEKWQGHPADVHVIGKDIVRFHAIIWPAMLMSAGFSLPKQIAANGFFTVNGVKISKSLGNAIDPIGLVEKYGTDALRYFLLREIPYGEDGDFSEEKLKERYNADLANGLGNLVSRVMKMAVTNDVRLESGDFYSFKEWAKKDFFAKQFTEALEKFQLSRAVELLFAIPRDYSPAFVQYYATGDDSTMSVSATNLLIQEEEPFKEKDPEKRKEKIRNELLKLQKLAILLEPILPNTSLKITTLLRNNSEPKTPIFPRIS